MKHLGIAIILFAFISSNAVFAQSCCNNPNDKFAALAKSSDFRSEHELPAEIHFQAKYGHMIQFACPDNIEANAYFVPAKKKSDLWLIVIHEWWGLNDHIKEEAEKLYGDLDHVNILALDMYDGNVAENREEASQYMQGLSKERAYSIISGMLNYIGNDAKLCTIGWCFGGGWSLQTAIESGKKAIGCVMYYGMPDEDASRLKKLNSDVLGIFASQDEWINAEVVATFETNMEEAGKTLIVYSYDADHAFANPSSPRYVEKAAQDAYKVAIEYLRLRFK